MILAMSPHYVFVCVSHKYVLLSFKPDLPTKVVNPYMS